MEKEMKDFQGNIVRLVLVFSACLVILFAGSLMVRFAHIRVDEVGMIPAQPVSKVVEFVAALEGALPLILYFSLLFGINYSARREISIPRSMICLGVLSALYIVLISLGIVRFWNVPASPSAHGITLGEPGLVLSGADSVRVLLDDPADMHGAQVVSLPGSPLLYQEIPMESQHTGLPPAPFRTDQVNFLSSIIQDFSLSAEQLTSRLKAGFASFLIYAFSLIFLLVSLRFVMEMSSWPLANLCLGALIFRGVLALERFINSPPTQDFLGAFLGDRFEKSLVSPLVFYMLGLLIMLGTALVYRTRGGKSMEVTHEGY
ncbi:MAG: hypothetical protein LBT14_13170 [Treponema sp.]|jgi:hypothetical protein|nr:hypothetical protein [Treponema sp.]